MIKVAGMWDIGWNTPIKEIDLWEMIIHEFQVDKFYMTPITGIWNDIVIERKNMHEILDENKDSIKVFVDIEGSVSLEEFVHPENTLYVFGKVSCSSIPYKKEDDISLRINTPTMKSMLWGHQILSIILYDRMIKNGSYRNR